MQIITKSSREWDHVSSSDKSRIQFKADHDGEFWLVIFIIRFIYYI